MTSWVTWNWNTPVYYSYGSGGSVQYIDNSVYVDGQQYATTEQYYQQAASIATNIPEIPEQEADQVEWMPLGVFALSNDGVSSSNTVLQLAVSKEGYIAGTYYNESTDTTRAVEGTIDRQTQRAAWSFADGKDSEIVMEAGIFNLTEDVADALIHFNKDKTQSVKMVRLDAPEDEGASANSDS